jgi:hypothetical protein
MQEIAAMATQQEIRDVAEVRQKIKKKVKN